MSAKHTPGPWMASIEAGDPGIPRSQGGGEKVFIDSPKKRIAQVKREGRLGKYMESNQIELPEVKANAALIAAAPDLLEACKSTYNWMSAYPSRHDEKVIKSKLGEAIAKAEGRA